MHTGVGSETGVDTGVGSGVVSPQAASLQDRRSALAEREAPIGGGPLQLYAGGRCD
jgi:hypothetical protein